MNSNFPSNANEQDELLIEQLLTEDSTIFSQYFNDEGLVPNLDQKTRKQAERLFNEAKVSAEIDENFEDFVNRIQNAKRNLVNCAIQVENSTRNVGVQINQSLMNNSSQTIEQTNFRFDSTLNDDTLCNNNYFDPTVRRTLPLNFTSSTRRRKEEFNALNFLMDKKINQDYYPLTFQPEEDIQDLIFTIESSPDKKRLDLLAEGVLRKIAEHLETLNRVCNYRLMNVYYEKEVY